MSWLINERVFLRVDANEIEFMEKVGDSETVLALKIDVGVLSTIWIGLTWEVKESKTSKTEGLLIIWSVTP